MGAKCTAAARVRPRFLHEVTARGSCICSLLTNESSCNSSTSLPNVVFPRATKNRCPNSNSREQHFRLRQRYNDMVRECKQSRIWSDSKRHLGRTWKITTRGSLTGGVISKWVEPIFSKMTYPCSCNISNSSVTLL